MKRIAKSVLVGLSIKVIVAMQPSVFWFFGRSGAGKTTLSRAVRAELKRREIPTFLLDGDKARRGLCRDLGFEAGDRLENHRRIAEVARLACEDSLVVLVATMAPLQDHRSAVDEILGDSVAWIFVDAPLAVCLKRDPKGLYAKAREGSVTGLLEYPFDPVVADRLLLHISTDQLSADDCVSMAVEGILSALDGTDRYPTRDV